MLRLLTALFIAVLVLSHGTVGPAAPHLGHGDHHHYLAEEGVGDHADVSDHHSIVAPDAPDDRRPDPDSPSTAAHAHIVADSVPCQAFVEPPLLAAARIALPPVDAALTSAQIPPLLEPPSA